MENSGKENAAWLEHRDLTGTIIGAAIAVHRQLGPGFLESIYENALVIELQYQGIVVHQQVPLHVAYPGHAVGGHVLDLLVNDIIIVELKAIRNLEDVHFAGVKSYLRQLDPTHGLLLNFAKPTLEAKRVIAA